jgi:SAM-dependent methyltransferase
LTNINHGDVPQTDYRQSHLEKGAEYDAALMADAFDAYMADREKDLLRRFIPALFPLGIDRYLDFACGTGRITELVSPHARCVVGVDVSESMIVTARQRCPEAQFVIADITREEHSLGRFDLVTAFRFLGNAQDELRVSALRVIGRLLNAGGYLLLNNHRNPYTPLALARRWMGVPQEMDLSHFKLRRLLNAADFNIVSSRGIGGWWIVRHKIARGSGHSAIDRFLDGALGAQPWAPFCPDSVIVAQKRDASHDVPAKHPTHSPDVSPVR